MWRRRTLTLYGAAGYYLKSLGQSIGTNVRDFRDASSSNDYVGMGASGARLAGNATEVAGLASAAGVAGRTTYIAFEGASGKTVLKASSKVAPTWEQRLAMNAENDFTGDGFPTSLNRVEGRTYFREAELVDKRNSPIAEFDEVDLAGRTIYEDKRAKGFGTNLSSASSALESQISKFVDRTVVQKTRAKMEALSSAVGIRPKPNGSATLTTPTPDQIRGIRNTKFRFEGDHPTLQSIMNQRLQTLGDEYPDYNFSARYGYKPEVDQ